MSSSTDKGWVTKALAQGGLRAIAFLAVKFALPFLVAAMTFTAGYLSSVPIPWMWIIMATSLSFAGVAAAVLFFDQLLERSRVKDRLQFRNIFVGFDKTIDQKNVEAVQLGFVVANSASFPVSYLVKRVVSTADATAATRGTILNWGGTVPPGGADTFKDRTIELKIPKSAMDATLEFEILYGREGSEKYPLSRNLNIGLRYDATKGVLYHPFVEAPRGRQ